MDSRRWIALTIATVLIVAAVDIIIAYMVDPYGIWRNPAGRKLPVAVVTNGRKAKFLMSKRYIPANFDGLIIGPSSIANWDPSTLVGYRAYNLSVDGGDAAEEKLVLDQALDRGHYRLAIFVLSPNNTTSHTVRGGLDSTTTEESLASFHLYIQEVAYVLRAAHNGEGYVDIAPDGRYIFHKRKDLRLDGFRPEIFQIDSNALGQFREMVLAMQKQGAAIVYVVPPVYELLYQTRLSDFQGYTKTIIPLLPKAPVIDFLSPAYTALRSDPDNFVDIWHTGSIGADRFSALLGKLVHQEISGEK
jgi:hypothetical protein